MMEDSSARVVANPASDAEWHALRLHMLQTYIYLRLGMGVLAAALPGTLYVIGVAHHVPLQGSMSAYYWAGGMSPVAPRVVFVGGLLALAAFLYLYRGFTRKESLALNIAAMFAGIVALFPMDWNCQAATLVPEDVRYCMSPWNPHGTSAVLLFLCLAFVALFCAKDTLPALENEDMRRTYQRLYWLTGALMIASPVTAAVLRVAFDRHDAYTFFIEASGVGAFSAYWIIKSVELRASAFERKVFRI